MELAKNKCTPERLEVWQRGVDTVRFNPSYKCEAMRSTLTDGHPEAPLLVHVGRLGAGESQSYNQCLPGVLHFCLTPCCMALRNPLWLTTGNALPVPVNHTTVASLLMLCHREVQCALMSA